MSTLLLAALIATTGSEPRTYLIAVGNNAVPVASEEPELSPLEFADDDAAALFTFLAGSTARAYLLSVLDTETQRQFPELATVSRAPTWDELNRAVTELGGLLAMDRNEGRRNEVILFFSGHGSHGPDGAFLALRDSALTQDRLYDQVLARLPADTVHLIVDACYAEAVVRPRDAASAEVVAVSADEIDLWNRERTLRRFPNVGAVVATSANQRAHEWDAYQRGVFTHQVLSGLRGAADINGDRVIEYSELDAFLSAANSGVDDPRARLDVLVYPPETNVRAPLVDLSRLDNVGWAIGSVTSQRFHIEAEPGQRLVDVHNEAGRPVELALPPGATLSLHTRGGEAAFTVADGEVFSLDDLELEPGGTAPRGALDSALHRGLFARPFGPLYYQGYVDSTGSVGVPIPGLTTAPPERVSTTPAWIAYSSAAALGVAAVVTAALALDARADYHGTDLQRPANDARNRYDTFRVSAFATGSAAVVAAGVGLWLWPSE